ncbi:12667_t:CDS:2, partial [Dentiscutata heterogama]
SAFLLSFHCPKQVEVIFAHETIMRRYACETRHATISIVVGSSIIAFASTAMEKINSTENFILLADRDNFSDIINYFFS